MDVVVDHSLTIFTHRLRNGEQLGVRLASRDIACDFQGGQ
jgi:hypothetical protein